MRKEEIYSLDNKIITEDEYDSLESNEYVTSIDCLGISSQYTSCNWYSVELINNDSINVFLKR